MSNTFYRIIAPTLVFAGLFFGQATAALALDGPPAPQRLERGAPRVLLDHTTPISDGSATRYLPRDFQGLKMGVTPSGRIIFRACEPGYIPNPRAQIFATEADGSVTRPILGTPWERQGTRETNDPLQLALVPDQGSALVTAPDGSIIVHGMFRGDGYRISGEYRLSSDYRRVEWFSSANKQYLRIDDDGTTYYLVPVTPDGFGGKIAYSQAPGKPPQRHTALRTERDSVRLNQLGIYVEPGRPFMADDSVGMNTLKLALSSDGPVAVDTTGRFWFGQTHGGIFVTTPDRMQIERMIAVPRRAGEMPILQSIGFDRQGNALLGMWDDDRAYGFIQSVTPHGIPLEGEIRGGLARQIETLPDGSILVNEGDRILHYPALNSLNIHISSLVQQALHGQSDGAIARDELEALAEGSRKDPTQALRQHLPLPTVLN